jgi:RimJ/RimL family protein N-acetyltransferase
MIVIETPRLILRTWKDSDIEPFAAMNQDPEVMKFFPAILSPEESDSLINRQRQRFKEHGFCCYAVELKSTGEFIGFVGLAIPLFEAPFMPAVEIGWRIAKAYWNQGYATEAAKYVLNHAFNDLNLSEVVSFTAVQNLTSRRVMEKIGMTHSPNDDFDHPRLPEGHPLRQHVLYRIRADQRKQNESIEFIPLNPSHFPLLLSWFNRPHVQAFWILRNWSLEEVEAKYLPRLTDPTIQVWMVFMGQTPIAFIQSYPVKNHPWPGQHIPDEMVEKSAGIDFFIGEESFLRRGYGTLILQKFIREHLSDFDFIFADPDRKNTASVAFFQALGFEPYQIIQMKNAVGELREYELMKRSWLLENCCD